MKFEKKYYKDLDLIRVLCCLAVLMYHLNLLKGGYLAVCTFFVLSGYLSCISAFRKEKFSLKEYYINRLKHIYLPLLIVVFISIFVISIIPSINWFNLKPETNSVLFGYNNFWQINANADYFARHIDSPFMHLWYISILLQFELVFPFIYILFRKIGDNVNKTLSCTLIFLLSMSSVLYFAIGNISNITQIYYNSFTRVFSLLLGFFLAFVHLYYKPVLFEIKNKKYLNRIIFFSYLAYLIFLMFTLDAKSSLFKTGMILSTLISVRLISYGTIFEKSDLSILDRILKFFSSISYEVYLVQYPVIFLLQDVSINYFLKLFIIIAITIILSWFMHFAINFKLNDKKIKLKIISSILILIVSSFGLYVYLMTKDHTKEMKQLEEQLSQNQKLMEERQTEYEAHLKEEQDKWNLILEDYEAGEEKIADMVTNLPIVGLGDSVMLGAINNLYRKFPNGYFDAKISRTAYVANGILRDLEANNLLGNPVIFNFGANGDCPDEYKLEILEILGDRKLFWVNVTNDNDVHVNATLDSFASKHSNVYIIDWSSASNGHPEYFFADGIHLTEEGRQAYTDFIYEKIYKAYLDDFNIEKQRILNEYEQSVKNKITFYGNDILLNIFDSLKDEFKDAKYVINKDFNYDSLKVQIEDAIANNNLTYKIVLAFDSSFKLSYDQYQEIIDLLKGHKIYILLTYKLTKEISNEDVVVIDFADELSLSNDYIMPDNIHFTDKGNNRLKELLAFSIK